MKLGRLSGFFDAKVQFKKGRLDTRSISVEQRKLLSSDGSCIKAYPEVYRKIDVQFNRWIIINTNAK